MSVLWASGETVVVMQWTWFSAFFNGISDGNYITHVNINAVGEAYPELILWIIVTPIIVYGSYLNIKLICKSYDEPVVNS